MIKITKEEIYGVEGELIDGLRESGVGGIVTFLGTVREFSGGERVKYLEYEAYEEMAEKELSKIEKEAKSKFEIKDTVIVHRLGRLEVGDDVMFVAVGAAHSKDAFLACEYIVDELKIRATIWKKEFTDKGERLVGSSAGATEVATEGATEDAKAK